MEYRKRCQVCGKIFCYTDKDINNNAGKTTYGMLFFLHPYYIICTVQIVIDSIVKRPHLRAAHFCFKPFLTNHSSKTGV